MTLRLITLCHCPALQGFDEEPLLVALKGHLLQEVESHFYLVEGRPHLALLLRFEVGGLPSSAAKSRTEEGRGKAKSRRNFLEQLEGIERERAEALRSWRAEKAKREGIPPFVILGNRQLVAFAESNPASAGALKKVEGFGEKSCERHGEEILQILAEINARAAEAIMEADHD